MRRWAPNTQHLGHTGTPKSFAASQADLHGRLPTCWRGGSCGGLVCLHVGYIDGRWASATQYSTTCVCVWQRLVVSLPSISVLVAPVWPWLRTRATQGARSRSPSQSWPGRNYRRFQCRSR
jgi:hypothetical protein